MGKLLANGRDDLIDLGLKAAVAISAVLLAIALVQGLWLVVITPPPPPQGPLEQAGQAQLPGAPTIPLADFHLFGDGPQPAAQVAPMTTLDLVLKGTFAAADQRFSRALIAGSGTEATYSPGMELPGGAKLESIHSDHVVLRVNGRQETLPLRPGASVSGPGPGPTRPPPGAAPLPRANASVLPGQPASFVNPIAGTSSAALAHFRSQAVPDPAALARSITALPVLEGGKFVGVRLNAGSNQALLARAGLEPTDIITEINGIPIDSLARGAQIAQQLQNARSAQVSVRRGGRTIALPPINLDGSQ